MDDQQLPLVASQRQWAKLGIASRDTLRHAIRAGELHASTPRGKRQVIFRQDLLEWLARRRVRPTDDHLERIRRIRDR